MTTFTTFDRGSAAPGNSPQPEAGRSAIDISKQNRQITSMMVCTYIGGVTACACAGLLLLSKFTPDGTPLALTAIFFGATSFCFAAWAASTARQLAHYIYNSELIIASQDLGLQELNADNAWLLARLRRRAGAGEADGAAMNSPSATIHQLKQTH